MNREPSTASRSLRAVSLAITLVSLITFSTMAYSAYADVSAVLTTVRASTGAASGEHLVVSGNTARLDINFSVPNEGLYPLQIAFACAPGQSLPVSCSTANVTVGPGLTQEVDLSIRVTDLAALRSMAAGGQGLHLNATAEVSLEPFASLSATFDIGSALSGVAA